eukprot:SAG22_NODE_943_length_6400_cov_3.214093_5_plen_256_part_00
MVLLVLVVLVVLLVVVVVVVVVVLLLLLLLSHRPARPPRLVPPQVIDDIKFSPDGRYLAAASHDNYIYVYDLGGAIDGDGGDGEDGEASGKLHSVCRGHSSYVTHIDWSADSSMLMSNSGDYELLYWTLSADGTRWERSTPTVRDVEWQVSCKHCLSVVLPFSLFLRQCLSLPSGCPSQSWTGVLGFSVMGIWQEGQDGTDYNALARAHNGQFCVGAHHATCDSATIVPTPTVTAVLLPAPAVAGGRGHTSLAPS